MKETDEWRGSREEGEGGSKSCYLHVLQKTTFPYSSVASSPASEFSSNFYVTLHLFILDQYFLKFLCHSSFIYFRSIFPQISMSLFIYLF